MKNEEGKVSPELLFFAAIILFVAAIVIYLRKEDSSYAQVAEGVKGQGATIGKIEKSYQEVSDQLKGIVETQSAQNEVTDKLMNRMQMLEMRLDAHPKPVSVSHKDSPMPQPLKVELTTPIKVIYREARPVPKLPKGKANGKDHTP